MEDRKQYIHYNEMNPKRKYSQDQVQEMYYDFYIKNLQNNLKFFDYDFLTLDQIEISHKVIVSWRTWVGDQFLQKYSDDRIKLAQSIIKDGTYWPIQVFKQQDRYRIYEGVHRVISLKIAQAEGLIDNSFKLLSIILPQDFLYYLNVRSLIKEIEESESYYSMDLYYGTNILNNPDYLNKVKKYMNENNHIMINEYTGLKKIHNIRQAYFSVNDYPLFLRDLLFMYPEVKPNYLINNEEAWYENYNRY